MKFSFQCLAVTHTSGRVTVTPLTLPELAVHAATLEQARFELALALDDRINRAHPRHLWQYCRPGEGTLLTLPLEVLPQGTQKVALPARALESPAHAGHTEVRLLDTELRFWFKTKGKELTKEATALLAEHLRELSTDALLALRAEGKAELLELVVEANPLKLSQLKKSELRLDARPPPKGLDGDVDTSTPRPDDDQPDPDDEDDDWDDEKPKKRRAPNKKKAVPTPTLSQLGTPWHRLAKGDAFPHTFGREALVEQVRAHVGAKDPEPLLLVGPAGVGKTAVLQELARRLVPTERPFFHLDGSRLVAGEGFFGDWQRQTLDAFAEAHEANAVLHLGRAVDLLDAGRSAHSDDNVAQLLVPTLAAREVAVVAEATPEEWTRLRDRNQSFARLFAPLTIDEPTPAETTTILSRIADWEGRRRSVAVDPDALEEVRSLMRRFRPYGSPLGSAVAFLRRLLEAASHLRQTRLTRVDVVHRFSGESGVPEELLRDDLPLDPAEVREFLATRVKGQAAAVERAAQVVAVIKSNLADPHRPVATLLLAGPTGVGKTELSKALTERVFGSKDRMVRLDMGEYAGPDALARLVGGGGEEGFLVSAVRRAPFSLVLLDEVEKAHPAVFDALLSLLGEGRLTDGRGRLASFRSCVVVMTSNLGATTLRPKVGFGGAGEEADLRAHYLAEIRKFFRPEFFNRLDDVVVFGSLGRAQLDAIVERELQKVAARSGFGRLDLSLSPSDEVKLALAEWGHEPKYGARPLKRALERRLVVPAAAYLAAHRPAGASRLEVTRTGEQLDFTLHPLERANEGSRAALLEVCDQAADLRGELRRWRGSRLMGHLLESHRLFERLARHPGYWHDRALADEQSRRAAATKDLVDGFDALRAQAEATEELAFDAYASRQPRSATDLLASLEGARTALVPLTERLFATRFPQADAVTLTFVPGRGAGRWVHWLTDGIAAWARKRDLRFEWCHLAPLAANERERAASARSDSAAQKRIPGVDLEHLIATQGAPAAVKLYREKFKCSQKEAQEAIERIRDPNHEPSLTSHEWRPDRRIDGPWEALALKVFGERVPMLLSCEHGTHRIFSEGNSFTVRCRFQPGNTRLEALGTLAQLERELPGDEVRRAWPFRQGKEGGLVKDLRTGTEHLLPNHDYELGPLMGAWLKHLVFGAQEGE